MASAAYYVWAGDGKPYRLCRPAAALQRELRGHGLTVYDYPNDAHLTAPTPEDHAPFSATGWPSVSAYGVGHAIDVMPRSDTAAGRKENADIARKLIADRNAGVPGVLWIKYLNWTDESGICRQERWMPGHTTRTSTDKGHIHVSARSDCDNDTRADGYDPLEEDMEQTDPLVAPWNANSVGNALAVLMETRKGLWVDVNATGYVAPKPASAIGLILGKLASLEAATAADEQRDAAALAAVNALAAMVQAGGGNVDTASIVAAVHAVGDDTHAQIVELQQQLAGVQARNLKLAQALAAAGVALDEADN